MKKWLALLTTATLVGAITFVGYGLQTNLHTNDHSVKNVALDPGPGPAFAPKL